jgi:TrmH family RNA methyltransferase
MLSISDRRELMALHRKKDRQEHGLFLVEGVKLVDELLASGWGVVRIVAVEAWAQGRAPAAPVTLVSESELARVSAMEAPNQVLAVARMPRELPAPPPAGLVLALAGIQDPGNMGTILRLADWFGVSRVVCSPDCAERFNPKVVQASMGSLFRVPVHRLDLADYLAGAEAGVEVAGACLDGENLFRIVPREPAVIVLGSEGRGIPDELMPHIRRRITIPRTGRAESLNVAAAASVICAEWRRGALAKAP